MAQTIQSYQIALGFKIDAEGLRKFQEQIHHTGIAIRGFATAAVALAVSVEEALRRTSKSYEDLFYLSQRTGVSANNLKAMGYAFSQIGLQAGQFGQIMDQITSKFLDDPGVEVFLKNMLGDFKGAEGAFKAVADEYVRILNISDPVEKAYRQSNYRELIRNTLGVDPDTFKQAADNRDKLLKSVEEANAIYRKFGFDSKKAAKESEELNTVWRKGWESLGAAFDRLAVIAMPVLRVALEKFVDWFTSDEVSGKLNEWATDLEKWITSGKAEKDLKAFADGVKESFNDLWETLKSIKELYDWLSDAPPPKVITPAPGAQALGGNQTAPGQPAPGAQAPGGNQTGQAQPGQPGQQSAGRNFGDIDAQFTRWVERKLYQLAKPDIDAFNRLFGLDPSTNPHTSTEAPIPADRAARPHRYSGPPLPASPFSTSATSLLEAMWMGFQHWWAGSSAFNPIVQISQDFYEQLRDSLRDVFGLGPGTGASTTGTTTANTGGVGGHAQTGTAGGGRFPGRVTSTPLSGPVPDASEVAQRLNKYTAGGSARIGGPSPITGVHPEYLERVDRMLAAMPEELRKDFVINSGYRDAARQAEVHGSVKNSYHTGTGPAGSGMAMDISMNSPRRQAVWDWIKAHPEFGVGFPLAGKIPGEEHHMEPLEGGQRITDRAGWIARQDALRRERMAKLGPAGAGATPTPPSGTSAEGGEFGGSGINFPAGWQPDPNAPRMVDARQGITNPARMNPGNLRVGDNEWKGKVTAPGSAFESFNTMMAGIRARAITYHSYLKRGVDTIANIAKTSGPAEDHNDIPSQIAAYQKAMGGEYAKPGGENLKIDATPENLRRLTRGGISIEVGGKGEWLPKDAGNELIDKTFKAMFDGLGKRAEMFKNNPETGAPDHSAVAQMDKSIRDRNETKTAANGGMNIPFNTYNNNVQMHIVGDNASNVGTAIAEKYKDYGSGIRAPRNLTPQDALA